MVIRQTLDLEAEIGPGAWDLSIPEVRARTARREARQTEGQVRHASAVGWGMSAGTKEHQAWVRESLGLPPADPETTTEEDVEP